MKKIFAFLPLLLAGCTSIEPLRPDISAKPTPSRLDEIAYINVLREAYETTNAQQRVEPGLCFNGTGLKAFNPTLAQGYNDHDGGEERASASCTFYRDLSKAADSSASVKRYVEAGFGITDLYCERFFAIANESAQKRRFERGASNGLDGLIGTVLGLSGAGSTATGIVNAGFAAVDSTFQNIDDSFLVAPDLANVRKLVHAAQQDFRKQAFDTTKMPGSYPAARAVIERYAGFCTFAGMKQLVNDSVTSQTQVLRALSKPPAQQNIIGTPAIPATAPAPATERPLASEDVPSSG